MDVFFGAGLDYPRRYLDIFQKFPDLTVIHSSLSQSTHFSDSISAS